MKIKFYYFLLKVIDFAGILIDLFCLDSTLFITQMANLHNQ